MGRKKEMKREKILTKLIGVKVTDEMFSWLEGIVNSSDCQTVPELVRRILEKKKVIIFHQDSSLDKHWDEIIKFTNEINSIGVNINQITHFFHSSDSMNQKTFYSLKVAEQYDKVGELVNRLISIITEIERKWLQK